MSEPLLAQVVMFAAAQMPAHNHLVTGGGQPHANVQAFLTINFIIALQGIFPARA